MKLLKLILENFRGYEKETIIPIDESMTAIVGRNDVGKSTILEALEIFFNSDAVKMDSGDRNINSGFNMVTIGCVFDELPAEIIVDEEFPTSFASEYLLNSDGNIEIRKQYKVQATVGKPLIFIRANHPGKDGIHNLHSLKISDLKKIGKELGVQSEVADQRVSSLWRKAIWKSCDDLELQITDIDVTALGKDSKAIYSKIDALLPTFALFKADRESVDADPEAKNPMQAAVTQAKKALQEEIDSLQDQIEKAVLDVAGRTLEKIREMDPNLASELNPRFKDKPKWTFNFTLDGDDGIPINKRGSGVRRLILLNFFRAEAEKKRLDAKAPRVIYAIEEPETSQHPNYQMMLIESLLSLSLREECQILLTTHVPALAGMLPTESIRFIEKIGHTPKIESGNDDVLEKAAASLGVLPESEVASAKAVLLVEGHSDTTFVHHSAEQLKSVGQLPHTLKEKGIAAIPIGGCGNLKHWVTKRLVEQLNINWAVLMDSDIGDPMQHSRNVKKIEEIRTSGKLGFLTKKREPENYIDPQIIMDEYEIAVEYSEEDDAKKIIAAATTTRKDDVLEKFWPKMTAEMILSQSKYIDDGAERYEIKEILSDVLSLC